MGSEAVIVAAITGFFGVVGLVVSEWIGKKDAAKTEFVPTHHDVTVHEHDHTRSVIRDGFDDMHRRFDALERASAADRQSAQIGESLKRIENRMKGNTEE